MVSDITCGHATGAANEYNGKMIPCFLPQGIYILLF
jgi:hypothetical protein